MAYDDYRLAPTQASNPWSLQGSPEQFYAPSSSLWGNYANRAGFGSRGLGSILGLTPAGAVAAPLTGLFEHATEDPKSLLTAKGWGDIGSFGVTGNRRRQEDAKAARRRAVAAWRMAEGERLGGALGQQGADVRADLEGDLQKALYAGGDMGDQNAIQNAMAQFQLRAQQYLLGRQRATQARQVDAMFADPRRAADRAQRLGTERTQGLADIAESYRIGQRNNAFNQARRGMQGSSVDVEQQGQLARGRDTAAAGLQAGLDQKARQYRLGDQQQRAALMGLIYADDPNTAAAFSRTLEGIGNQGKLLQEQQAVNSQLSAQRGAMATGYSQALGGAMSAASKPLGYYIEHRGAGA